MRPAAVTAAAGLLALTVGVFSPADAHKDKVQPRVLFGPEAFVLEGGGPGLFERPFTIPPGFPSSLTLCLFRENAVTQPLSRLRCPPARTSKDTDHKGGKDRESDDTRETDEARTGARVLIDGDAVPSSEDKPKRRDVFVESVSLKPGDHVLQVQLFGPPDSPLVLMLTGRPSLGTLREARAEHTATLRSDGTVLLAGGRGKKQAVLASAEVVDARTLQSTPLAESLLTPRAAHSATLTPSGNVMLAGGRDAAGLLGTAELFSAPDIVEALEAGLEIPRLGHNATQLDDGRVLLLGGVDASAVALAEGEAFAVQSGVLYEPRQGTFTHLPQILAVARAEHTATLLPSGLILVAGGAAGQADARVRGTGGSRSRHQHAVGRVVPHSSGRP